MYSASTYDIMKSYLPVLCETRKFVMAILHWKQELLCDNKRTMMVLYRSREYICNLYGLSRAGYYFFSNKAYPGVCHKNMFTDFLLCLWPVELKAAAYHQFFSSQCLVPFLTCSLAITRQQNFRPFQIETNCRRHFKMYLK